SSASLADMAVQLRHLDVHRRSRRALDVPVRPLGWESLEPEAGDDSSLDPGGNLRPVNAARIPWRTPLAPAESQLATPLAAVCAGWPPLRRRSRDLARDRLPCLGPKDRRLFLCRLESAYRRLRHSVDADEAALPV